VRDSRFIPYLALVCLALTISGFWLLEPTTPARIGALSFLVLVGIYGIFIHRVDVLVSSSYFFGLFDTYDYLFKQVLPIWIGIVLAVIMIFLLWFIVFGRRGLAVVIILCLLTTELLLAIQYVNLEAKTLILFTILPFVLAIQYYYFHVEQLD